MIVFLDDILVYSKTKKEHEEHLRLVMKVFIENQLYAKLSKCSFYHNKIHYLGLIVLEEGILVDPEKIEAIMKWPIPKNVSEVIFFYGISRLLSQVYRRIFKDCTSHNFFKKERYKF